MAPVVIMPIALRLNMTTPVLPNTSPARLHTTSVVPFGKLSYVLHWEMPEKDPSPFGFREGTADKIDEEAYALGKLSSRIDDVDGCYGKSPLREDGHDASSASAFGHVDLRHETDALSCRNELHHCIVVVDADATRDRQLHAFVRIAVATL